MTDPFDDASRPAVDDAEPSEITYDEQFYPARPRRLRPSARRRSPLIAPAASAGPPTADNAAYVAWLRDRSMLNDANLIAGQLSGQGSMWQNPFAHPDPRAAATRAQVWFTAYPLSLITRPGRSYLATIGDEGLWGAFRRIGIDAIHTGPVKVAGGLRGWTPTPSVDGHFDRVSMQIDPIFGTEDEYRSLCVAAAEADAVVIDDIIPGHTGKGADFRLAEMKVDDYSGIYHMVEISSTDWHLLPDVEPGADAANLSTEAEASLERAGYIIGRLQRVIFFEPGVKETNWSATAVVPGVDGVDRRWVYLHYFKAGQPSINWIDPSFAGMRLVIGDACHSIADLGSKGLRLDANGFLGVEKSAEGLPAWSEGHPLSEAANHFIASIVRKMDGFTFQELNLAIDDIKVTAESGADLSYDFINRPAYHHALLTGDSEFLRLTLNLSLEHGVEPAALVHALQNHDELTHELVHFSTRHCEEMFVYAGAEISGLHLGELIRTQLIESLTGDTAPYNLPFTTNGIACTTASVIAAALGIHDFDQITPELRATITRVHLLLAMFNALQPGVFAVSGWDLCGALTLAPSEVAELILDGDTRWINRGAHDLLDFDPAATRSEAGMPRAVALYDTLPSQLENPESFVSGLQRIIEVRRRYSIAIGRQVDVPEVPHKAMLVLVHQLEGHLMQVTALNFSGADVSGTIRSTELPVEGTVTDMFTGADIGTVDGLHSFPLSLSAYEGASLLITPAPSSQFSGST
jgi:trehalose synthase